MTGAPVPEVPHPGAPRPPTEPRTLPAAPPPFDEPLAQLRARRRLLMTGPIDSQTASRICAELMLLDGQDDGPVELTINSAGGPVAVATQITDVIALMRARVTTRCIGTAIGMAAVVLASGTGGRATASRSTISLRVDDRHAIDGRAHDIQAGADVLIQQQRHVAEHLAEVSTLSVDRAARELRDGGLFTPAQALATGLIDEVIER